MKETAAQTITVNIGTQCQIVLNRQLTSGHLKEPARRHKRKRIQKKWLKRYGYKAAPDVNIYVVEDPPQPLECCQTIPDPPRRFIMMHPATFQRFVKAFLGDEGKAAEAIYKSFAGGNKA